MNFLKKHDEIELIVLKTFLLDIISQIPNPDPNLVVQKIHSLPD